MGPEPSSVRCASVHTFKCKYLQYLLTSQPIAIKFHMKHHWGGVLSFEADRMRPLVAMATDNSHRVIMTGENVVAI